MFGDPFVTNPSLTPNLPFDPMGGFSFLVNLAHVAIEPAVGPDLSAPDVRAFIAMVRAAPQSMT